jgi:hypothetical protein
VLKPFWRYYGGKYRAAPRYPKPRYDTIIEPFAGAAGYSLRYPDRQVILIEKYHVIAEIWRYLISADPQEILATPTGISGVNELPDWTPQGLRYLVGFTMNEASASPCRTASIRVKRDMANEKGLLGWSVKMQRRIADQVVRIRHWRVIDGDYTNAPEIEATWFVDPPYQKAGVHYKHPSTAIDFPALGDWCRSRRGQVIACENEGADWLPFRFMYGMRTAMTGKSSTEVIWTSRLLDQLECRA